MAIVSFDDGAAETLYVSGKVLKGTGWSNVAKVVRRKLDMFQYSRLADLNSPPGQSIGTLAGNLKG